VRLFRRDTRRVMLTEPGAVACCSPYNSKSLISMIAAK
jgi:hypothetical protein